MKGLHHVGFTVGDLDASICFDHDVLGLPFVTEPSPWFDDPGIGPAVGLPGAALRQVCLAAGGTIDEGVLAGRRWVYFADLEGYPLELVEVAYTRPEERQAGTAEYLASRG